jgi:hypothetical protein
MKEILGDICDALLGLAPLAFLTLMWWLGTNYP